MPNMSLVKNAMPLQDPAERAGNFREVALGYSEEQAVNEAMRCLGCKNKPCVRDCPVQIDIPAFIGEIAAGEFEKAYQVIARYNALPAICGRVCPQETQCEGACVRGKKGEPVAIGRLERFAADRHNAAADAEPAAKPAPNGKKVAVVGSGPAGLACAGSLAQKGYALTIFEALHREGGVLVYGIPEFRLPKAIVQKEVQGLKDMGVEIQTNVIIGKTITIDELLGEYGCHAVFIGSGAGLPRFMNIPGENLNGVYSANEFLTRINLMKAYMPDSQTPLHPGKKALVVGGGNVAMDAARCALRLGAEVTIVYRRTEKELPARREEVEHAKEEGIRFMFLTNPLRILGNDKSWVTGIVCEEMRLSEPDESGRARPVAVSGSDFEIQADCVIMAIGTSPNPLIKRTTGGLETQKWGGITTEEPGGKTSREGVYAGGDAVTGAATVILAMGAGKNAAEAIDAYIGGMREGRNGA
ncbi:MAG: NADPH-dependent glutamate synthase [Spirochaetia bacterium]|jgi:glutamate synthase (NADPH/NADH) small chain|nr:NADPH-dependent glutamate synthase [Spirochaetia bacterium]